MQPIRRTTTVRPGATLVLAGALIVLGHALSVNMDNDAHIYVRDMTVHRPLHVAGGLLTATAALLLSVGLAAAARSFGRAGRRFARVAASSGSVGAAGLAMGLGMVTLVMGALTGKDPRIATRAYDILNHATLASLPFLLAYLFTIAMLALAVALLVVGVSRERWIGVLLLAGTAIDFVSKTGGVTTALLHLPQAAAFAWLGIHLLRPAHEPNDSASPDVTAFEALAQPRPAS
jgi:hypothetical protein